MSKAKDTTIKINDTFSLKRDAYQWILIEMKEGINPRTQKLAISGHNSYHSTLKQVGHKIISTGLGNCESFMEMVEVLDKYSDKLGIDIQKVIDE